MNWLQYCIGVTGGLVLGAAVGIHFVKRSIEIAIIKADIRRGDKNMMREVLGIPHSE